MDCVTPMDVNTELAHVQVQTPTRQFAFNDKGYANMTFNILQVGLLCSFLLTNCGK